MIEIIAPRLINFFQLFCGPTPFFIIFASTVISVLGFFLRKQSCQWGRDCPRFGCFGAI